MRRNNGNQPEVDNPNALSEWFDPANTKLGSDKKYIMNQMS
jgi:hypothetical protein